MASVEYIPSRGFWSAEVTRGRITRIQPQAFMKLTGVVLPLEVREVDDKPANGAAWKCHLAMWQGASGSNGESEGGMVATLVPFKTESVSTYLMLSPGEVYTFEVIGGGAAVHISGHFEDLPRNANVKDTEIRLMVGRPSRWVLSGRPERKVAQEAATE